jgi:hypothetical protein
MIDFARLPLSERVTYFQEVADRRGLTRLIVEKDFWVCFTLRMLFSLEDLADKFVFKGGTSLSKVFGIIKRFSEDIDLSVSPDWLGFGGENRPERASSRSQIDKRCKNLQSACIDAVKDEVCPALEGAITKAIGSADSYSSHLVFDVDQQTHSPVLIFQYPTEEPLSQGYIRPQVKLELGSLTDQEPAGSHTVTPWVAEELQHIFSEPNCEVVALEAERSFWEKVTILHAEYHRPPEKPMRSRLSRDCYDVVCMAAHVSGKRALADLSLLDRVVEHKRTYFHSNWANYEDAKPGTLRLVPPESRLGALKTDYQAMQEMFFETPPGFDELLSELAKLEKGINQPGS